MQGIYQSFVEQNINIFIIPRYQVQGLGQIAGAQQNDIMYMYMVYNYMFQATNLKPRKMRFKMLSAEGVCYI